VTGIAAGAAPFAGSFKPEQALSFAGLSAVGTWTLRVVDAAGADTGKIDGFELSLGYPAQPCGPYLRHVSHTVVDSCSGTGSGGGNGVIEPGEDVSIPVVLANTSTYSASNITATLTSSHPGVTITQGTASYGTLNAGQTRSGDVPFRIHVAGSILCDTTLFFDVDATASEGSWHDSFTLGMAAASGSDYVSADVPKAIPANTSVDSTIAVADTSIVTDVNVSVTIAHTWDGDLTLSLIGPNGASVPLSTQHGGSADNYTNTVFDDSAATPIASGTPPYTGTFRPDGVLSALNGIQASGTWKLRVQDVVTADTGTLMAWKIVLTTPSGSVCPICTATIAPPGEVSLLTWTARDTEAWTSAVGATEYRLYQGANVDLPRLHDASVDSCRRVATSALAGAGS
jgi:subtilisin-like proprotein convertase family protein